MSTKVSASVNVNPLNDIGNTSSGLSRYLAEESIVGIDYSEYIDKDKKLGFTKEINKSYAVGRQHKSIAKMYDVLPTGGNVDNPLISFSNIKTEVVGTSFELEFMPILEVKSDDNPDGVYERDKSNPARVKSEALAKAMNLPLKELHTSMVSSNKIPEVGSAAWGRYSKVYTSTSAKNEHASEQSYNIDLKKKQREKRKKDKDITDISIGYFGTFNEKSRTMPKAMYHTFLEILPKTSYTVVADVGGVRKFKIQNDLFESTYTCSGYIHREVSGVIKGNSKKKAGYSKVQVHLDSEVPLRISKGVTLHTDFSPTNPAYLDRTGWNNDTGLPNAGYNPIEETYVSIQVQLSTTKYAELILVDFYQENVVEGKGRTKIENSASQTTTGDISWKDAYIAESYIPLTRSAMLKVRLMDRHNLVIESKCHFIQVVNVTHLKWYQTGLFRALLTIVGIIISLWSAGLFSGAALSLTTLVTAIGTTYLIGYAISFIIEYLVELGILDNAFIIAIIAVALVAYGANAAGINLNMSLQATAIRLVEATGKVYQQELLKENKKHQALIKELAEENKKLAEAEDDVDIHKSNYNRIQLELGRLVDEYSQPILESPKEFYARALNLNPQPVDLDVRNLLIIPKG